MKKWTRRELLVGGSAIGAALALVGCAEDAPGGGGSPDAPVGPTPDAPETPDGPPQQLLDATPQCEEGPTEDQIEGPFYRAGAPTKPVLVESGDDGVRLAVSGRVLSVDCAILAGAVLDIWHADADGAYDTAGFHFRGKVTADAQGAYRFDTIIPGRYLNGDTYRPAHLHLKVSAAGHVLLTTQLYFEGDPFNESDPFLHPSLVMAVADDVGGGKRSDFDFVLQPT
jgi:protocatechuate 3,4-dioxygenase beta subunit